MNISSIGLDCVGCGSCEHTCPFKAISLLPDKEGFYFPAVKEDLCTDCGLCLKRCPQFGDNNITKTSQYEQKSYAVYSKLKNYYKRSASGGAFVTLAWTIFRSYENVLVCGVTFRDGRVFHTIIKSIEELPQLQGSKYVQSQLDDVYPQIKNHLEIGGMVLFSGTPCQVAGLYSYLGGSASDKLITIDIICHGVPSPKFFNKNLSLYTKSISQLKDVQFRWKHPLYKSKSQYCLSAENNFRRKTVLTLLRANSVRLNRDPYFFLFSRGWTLRESCYRCHYTNLNRVGDITIGDCDSYSCYPSFHPKEATSVLVVNSLRGESLWMKSISNFDYIDLNIQKEAEVNKQLRQCFKRPVERDTIYDELNSLNIHQIRERYSKPKDIRYYFGQLLLLLLPSSWIKRLSK